MNEITIEHIRKACQWAMTALEQPQPIDGLNRLYDQDNWDCGTACCIWGAASIMAGNGPATTGPPKEWCSDLQKTLLAGLMATGTSTPERILAVANLRDANLSDADLRDANLSDADLRGANLSGADLRDTNLSGADLRDTNLRDANLRDANLSGADLSDANLSGADLRDTNLRDANLRDANLSGATVMIGNVYRHIA